MQLRNTLLAATAALLLPNSGHADPIANWQVLGGSPTTTSGLDTASPSFGDGSPENADDLTVASAFGPHGSPQSVTLAIGETLTVSANLMVTGGLDTAEIYRIGVLDDGGQLAVPTADNWNGGWIHSVGWDLYAARTDGNALSIAGNAGALNSTWVVAGALDGDSTAAYSWTMTITRDSETTVDVVSSINGGDGVFSETLVASDVPATVFTYTALAIQATDAADLDQLSVSNARFVKPSPDTGTWALGQGSPNVSNMDTASPTVGNGTSNNADASAIHASILQPVTLANVGEKVTLSGSVTLSGINQGFDQFRFGLYDANGSSDINGWLGYFASQGNGITPARLYERAAGNTSIYVSTVNGAATRLNTNEDTSAPDTDLTNGTYDFSFTLELTSGGLQIDSSIIRASDSQEFGRISFLDTTPSTTTFDRVGFLIGNAINADQAQFSNIDVTVGQAESAPPRIASFTSLGGGLWELTLNGAPTTEYEFRSSTTLDFNPGTLVENLTQENPGSDPGDIGGSNGSVVTTDNNGDATIRLSLSGSPADFVRAQSLP